MSGLAWVLVGACAAANLGAIVLIMAGARAVEPATTRRYAWGCLALAGGILVASLLVLLLVLPWELADAPGALERATFLAQVISEAVNTLAFTVGLSVLPGVGALALWLRANKQEKVLRDA